MSNVYVIIPLLKRYHIEDLFENIQKEVINMESKMQINKVSKIFISERFNRYIKKDIRQLKFLLINYMVDGGNEQILKNFIDYLEYRYYHCID